MAYTAPTFTPSVTVDGNTPIKDADDKIRTVLNEAGKYIEVEAQSMADDIQAQQDSYETTIDGKIANITITANRADTTASSADAKTDGFQAQLDALTSGGETTYTTDAVDTKNKLITDSQFNAYGFTKALTVEDRFLETNIPNVVVDKVSEPVVFSDGLYERLGDELVTNGDFSDGTTGWSVGSNQVINSRLVLTSPWATYSKVNTTTKTFTVSFNIIADSSNTAHFWIGSALLTNNYLNKSGINTSGTYTYTFIASGNWYISLANASGAVSFDNISVKELQQATLPVAPFAPTSTDELLDDKVNGLTCQMAHSKGDVVVTGNELVTNGTFDTDTDWGTLPSGWSIGAGVLASTGVDSSILSQDIGAISGASIVITFEVTSYTSGQLGFYLNGVWVYGYGTSVGTHTITSTLSDTILRFRANPGSLFIGSIDNISVKLKDNIYQATVDTADMYDYDTNTIGGTYIDIGDVVYNNSNTTYGVVGNFYLRHTAGGTPTLLTTNLDDGTRWTDLGTASTMSLANPYFQTLPQVTRQDVITLRKHKTTKVVDYHTFKGTTYFGEGYSQADVMSHYGYTQVDKNLWEDATYEYVFVELRNSLNAGAFHPVYNAFGCAATWDSLTRPDWAYNWYDSGVYLVASTFDTIEYKTDHATKGGAIGDTATYRPDSKFYDKVYLNGLGGLIPSSKYLAYAGKEMPRLLDSESNDLLSESWLEEGVEIIEKATTDAVATVGFNLDSTYLYGSGYSNVVNIFSTNNSAYKAYVSGNSGRYYLCQSITANEIRLSKLHADVRSDFTAASTISDVLVVKKQPHLLTYKSSTTTDIIGNPANYPTNWLSYLASGKSIVGNALLVGQDGTNYVANGIQDTILSNKLITPFISTFTNNSGSTYTSFTPVVSTNINIISNEFLGRDTDTYVNIFSYTSANQSALQSDPQKVLQVQPKAIASNSHSVYKGAMMTYAGTGKVAVGNGSNGLESRVLENCKMDEYDTYLPTAGSVTLIQYETYLYNGGAIAGEIGGIYKRLTGTSTADISAYNFTLTGTFELIGFQATPQHNTISLDSSNSPAIKWFTTLAEMEDGELAVQTFSEEMIWDFDNAIVTGERIAGTSYSWTNGRVYRLSGFSNDTLNNNVREYLSNTATYTYNINDFANYELINGQFIRETDGYVNQTWRLWDGNGFGDNNKFNQLTNGTDTDLNNNTIQTKCLVKRLGVYNG